jgi:hypothetical protein
MYKKEWRLMVKGILAFQACIDPITNSRTYTFLVNNEKTSRPIFSRRKNFV